MQGGSPQPRTETVVVTTQAWHELQTHLRRNTCTEAATCPFESSLQGLSSQVYNQVKRTAIKLQYRPSSKALDFSKPNSSYLEEWS